MPTIVSQSYYLGQCSLLGELIEDTAIRYYYRRRFGDELAFVDKRSPIIHIVPWNACLDWLACDRGEGVESEPAGARPLQQRP